MEQKNKSTEEKLRSVRHIALDMDGTIYCGSTLFDCTLPFLATLRRLGIGYSFMTNNPTRSIADYVAKLRAMGVEATADQVYSTSVATIEFIKTNHPEWRRLFILGTASMTAEFVAAGFEPTSDSPDDRPDALVVSFDTSLRYERFCRAAWWVKEGLPYLATNPDQYCPTDSRTVLIDCAAIYGAIEIATSRRPDTVIGKPNAEILRSVARRQGVAVNEIAMVGDRLTTDVQTAHNAGAVGVLVLSGETSPEQAAAAIPQPHITVQDIGELGRLLESVHEK
ncbi:MAG: HAD-IIA family hydrolase [Tidjanibacter sp.]|nr:HAD-IIA family hydrolase [Tidjanibacter sp.]